ncbi:pilus assembly protein TadG-related protein [Paenibacillus qinlingensis]|uniref:Flp pilus assembly protein TadG n=1 Tax=Paenibacillus qinlingensis TaxID=1837343 RepID=A0ABU1NVR1_9BACL|nr:pilus assembly protein TadG-related protein [Paenibacillus qinlingensis]MDR6551568.1 Flp pilus assembly protein TadG [Paenibacillus qinlingensis]
MKLLAKFREEDGFSATFFAITMPVILAIMGIAIDGSYVVYNRIKLDMAADAAARAAIHSLDLSVWYGERKIVLNTSKAYQMVDQLMRDNMPTARLISLEIPSDSPNTCVIEVEAQVPLFFLRLFNETSYKIHASASSIGYDPNQTQR